MTAYLDGTATEYWVDEPAKIPFYQSTERAWRQARPAAVPGMQPGEDPQFPRDQFYAPPAVFDQPLSPEQIGLGPSGANTIQIGQCTFDRNFGPGIDISLPSPRSASSALVINGNTFRRNGHLRDDEPEASVHLRLRNVKGVSVTGNSFHGDAHPQDAQKGRSASPLNGILLEGLVDSVVANNSLFHAAQKTLIVDQGGHQNTTIRDNPGSPALPSQGKAGSVKP